MPPEQPSKGLLGRIRPRRNTVTGSFVLLTDGIYRLIAPLWIALAVSTSLALAQPAPAASPSMPPMSMPSASPATQASTQATPAPTLVVHVRDFQYVPKDPVVHVGDTIQFINDDETAHTVTADDKSYDSGYLAKGQTWSKTYLVAGAYPYFCAYHAFMRASVTVK